MCWILFRDESFGGMKAFWILGQIFVESFFSLQNHGKIRKIYGKFPGFGQKNAHCQMRRKVTRIPLAPLSLVGFYM